MQEVKDITIIGAGPTGLFPALHAGMRGATCCLIHNLDKVGGQLTALYPEKYIFDVAGFPKVLAKDLVKGMAEQAFQFKAPVHLGQKVIGLKRESQNGKPAFTVVTETDRSEEHTSELQSRLHLVCRLLLEKKKKTHYAICTHKWRIHERDDADR